MVVATDFEGVAQLVQVLLRCSDVPLVQESGEVWILQGCSYTWVGRVQLLIE
jgi:hypothetical protein